MRPIILSVGRLSSRSATRALLGDFYLLGDSLAGLAGAINSGIGGHIFSVYVGRFSVVHKVLSARSRARHDARWEIMVAPCRSVNACRDTDGPESPYFVEIQPNCGWLHPWIARREEFEEGKNGAGDGIRTHDNHVGNVMLYP